MFTTGSGWRVDRLQARWIAARCKTNARAGNRGSVRDTNFSVQAHRITVLWHSDIVICTGALTRRSRVIWVATSARDPRPYSGLPLSGPGRRTLQVHTGPTSMMNWRELVQARAQTWASGVGPCQNGAQRQDAHCTTVGAPLAAAGAVGGTVRAGDAARSRDGGPGECAADALGMSPSRSA